MDTDGTGNHPDRGVARKNHRGRDRWYGGRGRQGVDRNASDKEVRGGGAWSQGKYRGEQGGGRGGCSGSRGGRCGYIGDVGGYGGGRGRNCRGEAGVGPRSLDEDRGSVKKYGGGYNELEGEKFEHHRRL